MDNSPGMEKGLGGDGWGCRETTPEGWDYGGKTVFQFSNEKSKFVQGSEEQLFLPNFLSFVSLEPHTQGAAGPGAVGATGCPH